METRKIFKCLISSPGDCADERVICQKVIDKINNGLAKHLSINFETFMWEYDVLPDFGQNGQEIIDQNINQSNYDIFIGIMKNRFGHPTNRYGSGTEHEFRDALKRKEKSIDSLPKILFFFGKESVDPDKFDFNQYQKVKEFKSKISDEGLYMDFDSIDAFEFNLNKKLELFIQNNSPLERANEKIREVDIVLKKLEDDLNESLKTYNEKSPVWIEPILSSKREVPKSPTKNEEHKVEIKTLIEDPSNVIIKAPSEFGLTSLAHHIKLEAWKVGKTFLYIDAKKTKKHKIVKDIEKEIGSYFYKDLNNLDCILIDSVYLEENGVMQMIKNACDVYRSIPIIIFCTLDNNFFLKSDEDDKVEIKREFTSLYLLPLPQNEVRKLVDGYYVFKSMVEDKDIILAKVTKDLESLNMHRTAKNCISILRASAKIGTEYGPVNRTKLLETILTTIFEEYEITTYRNKKPDVKDCSFVLGYLCENLVIENNFEFTEEDFKIKLKTFCDDNFIDLDLGYLLDVLINNSIFVKKNSGVLYFKNSYWVFYFIAQRMNMSKDFLYSIYDNKKYIDFPEIIEFYTGIDRNKEDALLILSKDLDETLNLVKEKVNIPDSLNPYKSISWNPDIEALEKEEAKIGENVISSGFPDEIKDKYNDNHYDQVRPYNQVINSVIRDYSFLVLMRQITACSRALRNSDFVSPILKKELLEKIVQAWNEVNKLLIVLSPILADRGNIAFEGASFHLWDGDFDIDDPIQKRLVVLLAVPSNIVRFFKDDLFSSKMGPLIIDKALNEKNSLIKHELMEMIICERVKGWHKVIDGYIVSLDKNSFFLSDILDLIRYYKDFGYHELEDKKNYELLAKKCIAKHVFKKDNPDMGLINKVKNIN